MGAHNSITYDKSLRDESFNSNTVNRASADFETQVSEEAEGRKAMTMMRKLRLKSSHELTRDTTTKSLDIDDRDTMRDLASERGSTRDLGSFNNKFNDAASVGSAARSEQRLDAQRITSWKAFVRRRGGAMPATVAAIFYIVTIPFQLAFQLD
eukprot:7310348-Prymnesium_polylepis.1